MKHLFNRFRIAWRERAFALKAISFALVGLVNTLIDLGVFLTAYKIVHLPLVACNIVAWVVAVSGSYLMNTFITFGPESGRQMRRRDYATFVASGVAGVIAATTTLVVLSNYMPVVGAKLISILVSFTLNFALSHFVVFRAREGDTPSIGS